MTARFEIPIPINLSGTLIVAAPAWNDPTYQHSVALILNHSPERAAGILLTGELRQLAAEAWGQLLSSPPKAPALSIQLGGPHAGPVVALHQRADHSEFSPASDVHLAAHVDHLRELIKAHARPLKLLTGQVTWGKGELDRQLSSGCWFPLAVDPGLVFAAGENMWPRAIRQVGNHFVASITGARGLPPNVLAN